MLELALIVEEFPPGGEFSDFIFLLKNSHLYERVPGSQFLVCENSCDPCCQTIFFKIQDNLYDIDYDDLENLENLENGKWKMERGC